MLSLYEILKASKTGIAPDMWTALAGMNWGGADSGHKVKELTGIPPLSFTADGTPLLDYLISGNTVQNGTPTPTNPVEVNGVGERTDNIADWYTWVNSIDSIYGGGSYTATATSISITSGTSTDAYTLPYGAGNPSTYRMAVKPNTTYSVSIDGIGSYQLILWKNGITASGYGRYFNSARKFATITTDSETTFFTLRAANVGSLGSTATLSNVMIVEGKYTAQTMPTYEPYGYKIPISSGGVTTNIYLGSTQTTRQIGKYIFDGSNIFTTQRNAYRNSTALFATTVMSGTGITKRPSLNNYFVVTSSGINPQSLDYACSGFNPQYQFSDHYYIRVPYDVIGMTDSNTDNEFIIALNTWLSSLYNSGNPMIAYYALATPETAAVNEPLMKIGDYADTVSMEQAGGQIPTNMGNTVIDVETTLKPSEMYIKYKG